MLPSTEDSPLHIPVLLRAIESLASQYVATQDTGGMLKNKTSSQRITPLPFLTCQSASP